MLLRGTKREEVERGQVLAKPGSITPHTKFTAEVYVLSKDEGGRHTPFFNGYRPQFYFRTTDVTGSVELPRGHRDGDAGDNVSMTVRLINADRDGRGPAFAILICENTKVITVHRSSFRRAVGFETFVQRNIARGSAIRFR